MRKWNTKNCIIYQILRGRSNSFLINQENRYILVDTGRKNSWKELSGKIDHILDGKELSYLILTHTHFDHAENAMQIKEKYKSEIIVHEWESEDLRHGESLLPHGTNIFTEFGVNIFGKILQSDYKYETAEADILVNEKYDLSNSGINAYIIHTPGHSMGSMSVIIDDEVALAGDTLFGVFPNSAYPPFAHDTEIMVKSWEKLLETKCRLFLPGHGRAISRELLEKQYKKHKM